MFYFFEMFSHSDLEHWGPRNPKTDPIGVCEGSERFLLTDYNNLEMSSKFGLKSHMTTNLFLECVRALKGST